MNPIREKLNIAAGLKLTSEEWIELRDCAPQVVEKLLKRVRNHACLECGFKKQV